MLRVLLVTILLMLETVVSLHTYQEVDSIYRFATTLPDNESSPYFQIEFVSHDENGNLLRRFQQPTIFTFLQDITPDLGLQLAVEWQGILFGKGSETESLQDVEYQAFCSALENKTLQSNPYYPDPIALLGLSGLHCPIKKNTEVVYPWDGLPRTIQAEFEVECGSWILFIMDIEAENSTTENRIKYLQAGWMGHVECWE